MGCTGEVVADEYRIGRAEQDEFATGSHRKAAAAIKAGSFKDEIVPVEIPQRKGAAIFSWYPKVQRGIRLADGTGRATDGDQHPDPMAEAIRWQTHEGELVQAMGRARAINRTADTPLDIDLLFDTCLPIVVDEVKAWAPPSLMIETAIEGVMLTSPIDRMRLWPRVWPNRKAAMGTLVSTLPGFEAWPYQLAGPKMNRRLAHFDRSLIPDPAEWLQTRLGPLAPL
jgi:putative DNA primase/helicase